MCLQSLYLHNFRCYDEGYFEFSPHLNLIFGPNARGKTSLLEAIRLLMIGRSFRTTQNSDFIKIGTFEYHLEALFTKHGIADQRVRISGNAKEKKLSLNHTSFSNLSNLLGLLPGVVQTPDDINLVKGSPLLRRQFLDIQIAQIDPLYVHHLTRYNKALRQRNHLLRSKKLLSIESWEYEMAQSAAYLLSKRYSTIQHLQTSCQKFYAALAGEDATLTLKYRTNPPDISNVEVIKEYFFQQYQKNREREKILGFTLTGPHKDDFTLALNDKDVRFFASEGQQRSCATALHFSEWQNIYSSGTEKPIFLIDDVGMSLDSNRSKRLLEQLFHLGQVFLTTTDRALFDYYPGDKKAFAL